MNTTPLTDTMTYLNTKEVLTVDEAATYTGLKRRTIVDHCTKGHIAHCKPTDGLIFIERTDLITWLTHRKKLSNEGMQRQAHKLKVS